MRPRQRRVTVNTKQPRSAYTYHCPGEQVLPRLCSQSLSQEKPAEQAQPCMLTVWVVVQLLSCVQVLRLHGLQPTRLLCPWDFLSKNASGLPFPSPGDLPDTGIEIGLMHYRRAPALQLVLYWLSHRASATACCCYSVAPLCPAICNPMDCSPPGFPVLHHLTVRSNSHPLSRSCPPAILSSVFPFSSCLQSFPSSRSFPVSQLFTSGGQSIGPSVSASVLSVNIQGQLPLGLTGLISLQSKRSHESSPALQLESISFSALRLLCGPTLTSIHDCWKNHSFDQMVFCWEVISLLFNILSRFVIAFFPQGARVLISWLVFTICSDFGAQENKVCHCFHCFPFYLL